MVSCDVMKACAVYAAHINHARTPVIRLSQLLLLGPVLLWPVISKTCHISSESNDFHFGSHTFLGLLSLESFINKPLAEMCTWIEANVFRLM